MTRVCKINVTKLSAGDQYLWNAIMIGTISSVTETSGMNTRFEKLVQSKPISLLRQIKRAIIARKFNIA